MSATPTLPIAAALPELLAAIASHSRIVLEAPPGAGKTTAVPLALLRQAWCAEKKIILLEPRRIAARSAAQFMAKTLAEPVGETVGYRIRFDNQVGPRTRLEIVTEGVLTRMVQADPSLPGVACVIFDEFHERHLHADLALALCLEAQSALCPELKILVMSATLDGERLANFLAPAGEASVPRIRSEGKSFPVEIEYLAPTREEALELSVARGVMHALARTDGDILVFLPGKREIERASRALSGANPALMGNVELHPLHGELSVDAQALVIQPAPAGSRKVVLATNVAESSLTLPGVRAVVDSGLARQPRFDPNTGFATLQESYISAASATQRAGRAGRVAPGLAIRLWPESKRLELQSKAEILHTDLSGLALELAAWGDSSGLAFLDPPPAGVLSGAQNLLLSLGALELGAVDKSRGSGTADKSRGSGTADKSRGSGTADQSRGSGTADQSRVGGTADKLTLTAHGKRMLQLGTHPRLANMLVHAQTAAARGDANSLALACDVLALIEARDPFKGGERFREDWQSRWQALQAFRARPGGNLSGSVDRGALASIDFAAKQWRQRLRVPVRSETDVKASSAHAIGDLLLHAFPDRVAKVRQDTNAGSASVGAQTGLRYALANGRGGEIQADSPLRGEPWLIVSELDGLNADARIRRGAPFDEALLEKYYSNRYSKRIETSFDAQEGAVKCLQIESFDQLILLSRSIPAKDAEAALCRGIRSLGLSALPLSDNLKQWRDRVMFLQKSRESGTADNSTSDQQWPDFSDAGLLASLEDWLGPYLIGKSRLSHLNAGLISEALLGRLSYAQQQLLEAQAPKSLTVPSGMQRSIEYTEQGPVLAVKLQELFGLADSPRIAFGRVPLTLHLLSPGGKPVQVTQDLKNFWNHTYAEVKKELKGRYPKHPWPDDPWNATATHRAKPRGT